MKKMTADAYDFIIVGAGSAGAALAHRLTENPKWQVLLLEAGAAGHWASRFPVSFGLLIDNPAANWCYRSEPEETTAAASGAARQAFGRSSAINGLVFARGQPLDYDTWGQLSNRGWSFPDVLPIFGGWNITSRAATCAPRAAAAS